MALQRTWLVQRLEEPYRGDNPLGSLASVFSFGGGLKNGGLSDEAMKLLSGIFQFEYMGSAEFEFGAVPETFHSLANRAEHLFAYDFQIPLTEVAMHWSDEIAVRRGRRKAPPVDGDATVYLISDSRDYPDVEERVRELAAGTVDLKESSHLPEVLRPAYYEPEKYNHYRSKGWIELDNGFMFFTDQDMYEAVAQLFGVEVGVSP